MAITNKFDKEINRVLAKDIKRREKKIHDKYHKIRRSRKAKQERDVSTHGTKSPSEKGTYRGSDQAMADSPMPLQIGV